MSEQTHSKKINRFIIHDLGLMEYGLALEAQESAHARVKVGSTPEIIAVEHPNVLTFGKNSSLENLLFSKQMYLDRGIQVFETDRGGEVTAHMPGQLVIYPILPMSIFNMSVRRYVEFLEGVVIDCLRLYEIESHIDQQHPGVWVGSRKICAIGVRVKERVSMHGIAINVCNSFDVFDSIVPCGIRNKGVTSITRELGQQVTVEQLKLQILPLFSKKLTTLI